MTSEALADRDRYADLPEWLDLEQALALKRGVCPPRKRTETGKNRAENDPMEGGASITTYRQRQFLQPCCGLNYRLVGGRKCWRKEDVIEWLSVTDENLKTYAEERQVKLPSAYQKRAKQGELE
jgi:hypothetical protein